MTAGPQSIQSRTTCGRRVPLSVEHAKAIPPDVRRRISALRATDNWRNLLYIGTDWAIVAGAIVVSRAMGMNPAAYLLAVIVIGSRQRALRSLVHEASHRKLFRNRWLNDQAGRFLVSFPLMTSMTAYTCAHCQHHGFLWDPARDPKMAKYGQQGLITAPPPNRLLFAARHILRPLLLVEVPSSLAASLSWRGAPCRETVARYVYWGAAVAGAYWTSYLDELALFWLVPFCSTYHIFRYWSDIADHAGLYSEDPWRGSRSWEGSWLTEQLIGPHSAHLHFPHHLFPLVPHYRGRELHSLLMRVPEYAAGHHCNGFFRKRRRQAPSVLQDILRGEMPRSGAPAIRTPTASASVH